MLHFSIDFNLDFYFKLSITGNLFVLLKDCYCSLIFQVSYCVWWFLGITIFVKSVCKNVINIISKYHTIVTTVN